MKTFLINIVGENNDSLTYYEGAESVMEAYDSAIEQARDAFNDTEISITVQEILPSQNDPFWSVTKNG